MAAEIVGDVHVTGHAGLRADILHAGLGVAIGAGKTFAVVDVGPRPEKPRRAAYRGEDCGGQQGAPIARGRSWLLHRSHYNGRGTPLKTCPMSRDCRAAHPTHIPRARASWKLT